jgi:hypothetical protein
MCAAIRRIYVDRTHLRIFTGPSGEAATLAAVKKKYDPANFFRVNQNVRPELAAAGAA